MTKLSLFALLLLMPAFSQAQEMRITGRVVDAKTKEPVPFASIGLLKAGAAALTNQQGYFQLAGLEKDSQDSLIVMTLGYHRYAVLTERGKMEPLAIELNQRPTGMTTTCRVSDKRAASSPKGTEIAGVPGTQYAFFLKNEKQEQQLGEIQAVSFYLGEGGFPKEEMRVRVYAVDSISHGPGADLLNENIYFSPSQKSGWYTCVLRDYHIAISSNKGFFLAVEYGIFDHAPTVFAENYTPSGHIINSTTEQSESNIWSYTFWVNNTRKKRKAYYSGKWNIVPANSGEFWRYNTMFRVEVNTTK